MTRASASSHSERVRHFPRKYVPSRGGHAPDHLRQAIVEALELSMLEDRPWWESLEMSFYSQQRQDWWDRLEPEKRGRWVLGRLWNCTDTAPGSACDAAGVPTGSSYASLVRILIGELR